MINGIKISQIPQIKRNQVTHIQRLSKISDSRNKFNYLSLNFKKMLSTKKNNHENWKNYHKNHENQVMSKRNSCKYGKKPLPHIVKCNVFPLQQYQRTIYRHHNSKVQNIKRVRIIDEENPQIIKRIIQKPANFSHEKDIQQFRKTRKVAERLKKFQIVKRMTNIRSKTLPAKSLKNNSQPNVSSDLSPKQ